MKEEFKAGIIVVSAIAILSIFIILIGGGQLFEKFDIYYVKVLNAAGLETGAQVKLGGVKVGRVLSVKPPVSPGEPVTIEIGLKKGTVLYKGTKAYITQIGFVGDIYMLLSVKDTTNEIMKVGSVIPSEEYMQMDVLMAKLNNLSLSVDKLINDVDKIFTERNIKGIENIIGNTNKAIVTSSENIDKVAASLKNTTERLEKVLNEIESLLKDNKGDVSQLLKKARENIDKAGDMMKSIEKTSKSVDRTVIHQSKNIDQLINSMTRTTEELQEVLQEIKNKPWSLIYKEGRGE
ncbi:MAG: MCE family protein [Nitrospirae bacterium]|jgi:ABC-type transporter Mla subunit MlaD|nr:MCE family protein [Nitrospirota bacterium]